MSIADEMRGVYDLHRSMAQEWEGADPYLADPREDGAKLVVSTPWGDTWRMPDGSTLHCSENEGFVAGGENR